MRLRLAALASALLAVLSLSLVTLDIPAARLAALSTTCDLRDWYGNVTPRPVGYWPAPVTRALGGFASVRGAGLGAHATLPVSYHPQSGALVIDLWLTITTPGVAANTIEVRPLNLFRAAPPVGQALLILDGVTGRLTASIYGRGGTDNAVITNVTAVRAVLDGTAHHLRLVFANRGADIRATVLLDGAALGTRTLRGNQVPDLETVVVPEMARRYTASGARDIAATVSHVAMWDTTQVPLPCR